MVFRFKPSGVCAQAMTITWEGDTVLSVEAQGGCSGNLQGIASLVAGMKIDDVISRLEGIRCGWKKTSCPDQLAKALRMLKEQNK